MKNENEILSWDECSQFMTVNEVARFMKRSRNTVNKWFNDKSFPVIEDGIKMVEKHNLRIWLNLKYANNMYDRLSKCPQFIVKLANGGDLHEK